MKKSTVKNLVIGTVALIGIGSIVGSYVKNKKREKEYKLSKERLYSEPLNESENKERSYITLAEFDLKNYEKVKKVI